MPDQDLSDRFCYQPFRNIELHLDERAYFCCPSWTKKYLGDYPDQSLEATWNSPVAQEIRASILDGSFRYCRQKECGLIQGNDLPKRTEVPERYREIIEKKQVVMGELPETYMFCNDRSCNLYCPSCRSEKVNHQSGTEAHARVKAITDRIVAEIFKENSDRPIVLNITGSGDPFGSDVYRKLLEGLSPERHPNFKVDLQTNGVMLTPGVWERMKAIHRNIRKIGISIDAATEPTYRRLRLGGDWKLLLKNIEFLCGQKKSLPDLILRVNMVVQRKNFREMGDFARRFLAQDIDIVYFNTINDWQLFPSPEAYHAECPWRADHPEHADFLESLRDPVLSDPRVRLNGLTPYFQAAFSSVFSPRAPQFSPTVPVS